MTIEKDRLVIEGDIWIRVFDNIDEAVSIIDRPTMTIVNFNKAFLDQLGVTADEVKGKRCFEIMHRHADTCPEPANACPVLSSINSEKRTVFEHRHVCKDGRIVYVEVSSSPLVDIDGNSRYMIHVARDVTDRKKTEAELVKMKLAVEASGEIIFLTDRDGLITFINPEFTRLYGYSSDDVVGKVTPRIIKSDRMKPQDYVDFWQKLLKKEVVRGVIVNKTRSGRLVHIESSANPILDEKNEIIGFLAIQRDVSERNRAEERLNFLAYHDSMTGLPNRQLFNDRLAVLLNRANRFHQMIAVMILDIDNFKDINDTLGHNIGDQVLQVVGRRLAAVVREIDTVARMGGDEFIFINPDLTNLADAGKLAQRIVESFSAPIEMNSLRLSLTISLGISIYPSDGDDINTLMKNADIAMYRAKRAGGGKLMFYGQS